MLTFRSSAFANISLRRALLSCAAALPLAIIAQGAHAQIAPGSVPSSVNPSHVDQQFQTPNLPPQEVTNYMPAPQTATVAIAGPMQKQMNTPFVLKAIQVDESTVYPAGTFDPLFDKKIGTRTTLQDLRVIAREITSRYRKDGYVLSQAVIPNQDLKSGVFHVRIVEGFVDKVIVKMDNPNADRRGLIKAYGEKIAAIHPLNTKQLERYMLLANDLPGMQAKALLQPSPNTFGAADLVIEVTTKMLGASFTSDNRGNKFLGPWQEQATATENSAAGLGERTTIRGINTIPTKQLHFFDIQNEEQLGTEGTRLIARAGFTRTRPGDDLLKPLDLSGESDDYALTVWHPFIRSRAQNLSGHITYEARDGEDDAFGDRIDNDRVRALRFGANYDTTDLLNGADNISGEASQGLAWFNATSEGLGRSNPEASQNFLKFNADASRVQNLPYGFSFLTAATAQVSSNALPVSEQFTLGGVGFGQAYDQGEVSGDQGIGGKIELRYGQQPGYAYFDSYQLYSYYDIGDTWVIDHAASTPESQSLASVGAGVRANLNQNFYGYLEAGWPLTHTIASEGNRDPRIFFSVTGRY